MVNCCIIGCKNFYADTCDKTTSYHSFPNPEKELDRYNAWIKAIRNHKIRIKDSGKVFRQYRVCRKHFNSDCFNGGCKRLQPHAIPTLYLSKYPETGKSKISTHKSPPKITLLNINRENNRHELMDIGDYEEDSGENSQGEQISVEELEYVMLDVDYGSDNESNENINENLSNNESTDSSEMLSQFQSPISREQVEKWKDDFYKDQKNVLAQNICSRVDPFDVCLSRKVLENTQHVYTYKVESEAKPMTNQKNSGRCWIFATLNSIRIPFIKQHNLEEFEFSQAFLFYWDKIERCHYFLNNIIESAIRMEPVDGRLVSFLLNDPTCDGGQWDMIVNLINKYGLMPKKCFPESFSAEASPRLNAILKSKLREYAKILRDLIESHSSIESVKAKLSEQMSEIYNVVGICLGIPNDTFKWEYYDKSKAYHSTGEITSLEFYEKYVKPYYNVDDKVCLVTDPRPSNSYGEPYTVEYLGNVVGGRPVLYNNQPVELLMDLVTQSLKNGEAVWFGCEVAKRFAAKLGIEDLNIHDFKLVFGVDIQTTMSKADRLIYGDSAMTHAMTFTAVSCNENSEPIKFRVENSWGEDRGEKGYLIMSAEWFKEFVFEIVVDKSIVPAEVMNVFNMVPTVLPAWDPMGTLAK